MPVTNYVDDYLCAGVAVATVAFIIGYSLWRWPWRWTDPFLWVAVIVTWPGFLLLALLEWFYRDVPTPPYDEHRDAP
jgi:chromate transport protein ChrA